MRVTAETGLALSPTEERNPASMHLDRLPLSQAIDLMLTLGPPLPRRDSDKPSKAETPQGHGLAHLPTRLSEGDA